MNSLTKWESVILKNEFNSKYSKFFVTYDFFRKISKELEKKSLLSKKSINKLMLDNNKIISNSINEIEKDIKKILLPLSGYLEKNFRSYLSSYKKHYNKLSKEERLSSLKPKYFYKIAKPLFKQRYDNVIDAISTSLHDFEDIILSECQNITTPFFDSLDAIYVFNKNINSSLDYLHKDFTNLSKQSKSVLYGFISEFKAYELDVSKLENITEKLLNSRNLFLESWSSFKKSIKASFLNSSQTLMFGVIESGDLIVKKHEIIDNVKVWFPDIKEVISNRINI
ncbi:MAG: hypothetical protein HRS57_01410, partial [Mycoplasmataceae bacterium]|nr:hypothetical protein [Mycoplasmataceae bacterium]